MTKINIILLGESGVGKTTVLLRFQTGQFPRPDANKATCGVDFQIKKITIEDQEVTLFIWDTAGEERHRSVVRSYYRQGEGVLLVYDVTNPESFYKLSGWLSELRNINENAEVLIAGNKDEDPARKAVAISAVKNFAREEKLEYIEMSAMSGKNVEEAFFKLAKKILIAKGLLTDDTAASQQEISSDKGKKEKITPKKRLSTEDNDVIRLEATPEIPSVKKKSSCC